MQDARTCGWRATIKSVARDIGQHRGVVGVPFILQKTQRSAESVMTKKEALSIVFSCAPLYKENLVDKSLLFITTDKHKSVHAGLAAVHIAALAHLVPAAGFTAVQKGFTQ